LNCVPASIRIRSKASTVTGGWSGPGNSRVIVIDPFLCGRSSQRAVQLNV
jgi:hypothetical protein